MHAPVVLDGSHLEGGGALLRTALAVSALTQQPVRVEHVRGGTAFPGLDIEDLVIARALAKSTRAEMVGAAIGSTELSFLPTSRPRPLDEALDLPEIEGKTRLPNAPIVLATLAPVLARSGGYSRLLVPGETYGSHALGFDALANTICAAWRRFGLYTYPDLERAGFGRDSEGRVALDIEPSALLGRALTDRGRLVELRAQFVSSGLPVGVGQRGVAHLRQLAQNVRVPLEVEASDVYAPGPGIHLTVWATYDNGFAAFANMGSRGVRVETLAQSAFQQMVEFMASDATVDPFLADHLVIPAAFAEGASTMKVATLTKRLLTIVWVVKQFLPIHLTVRGKEGEPGTLTVTR